MATQDDSRLRAFFEAQKKEELEQAPPFKKVLGGSPLEPGGSVFTSWKVRWALACSLAVLVGFALIWNYQQSSEIEVLDYSMLSKWESPTEFLLDLSDDVSLSTVPEIEFGLEWMENESEWTEEPQDSEIGVILPGGGNDEKNA